jgi:hypothetical protein
MRLRAVLIDPAKQKISDLHIPPTLPALRQLIGPNMDFGWVSDKTQIVFCEGNGAAYFCLPGSPKLGKAVVRDCQDGEFCNISITPDEVAARVQWGAAASRNKAAG